MDAGKPQKQSLAIAYAMKKKAQHKAKGGPMMCAHGSMNCHMCHGGQYAEGGEVAEEKRLEGPFLAEEKSSGYHSMPEEHERSNHHAMMEDDRMLNQHGEHEEGAMGMAEDNEPQHERMISHTKENQSFPEEEHDLVGRIMKQRMKHYSEGGKVANDTPVDADFEDNQFDDLVKDDDLDSSYTGANSGDELGNDQEDEDRHDIISRIMKSRKLKDRMPHPA